MKDYVMALDQGTTSSRCILFDKKGNIRAKAQKEYTQIYPQPGWVEHNPKEIWSSQYSVMTEAMALLSEDEKITAIGITNQRETTIVWDKETGEPVYNAIVWQCRRTAQEIDELKENQVQIKYIIDQRADEIFHEKYEVFKYSSKLPKVDLIIMTVINDEEEIKNKIKYELDCDVYSLDEILDEMLIVGE